MIHERITQACDTLGFIHLQEIYDHFAEEASKESISYLEFLDKILWAEIEAKKTRATKTNLRLSKLPYVKQLDEFDFEFQPSANKRKINELRTLGFLERSENVIFLGPPGVGKTHLAVGLAVEALKNGYTAYFLSAHELIAMIRENISTGKIHRKIKALSKPGLLIIDEVGYAAMEDDVANVFFQIISNRYEKGSIILTSNKSTATGERSSGTRLWLQLFWTGCCITRQPSTSKVTVTGSRKRKRLVSMIPANLMNNNR